MDSERKDLQQMKALVAAVVARACEDVKLGHCLAAQAIEWLTEPNPTEAWSFEWCCAILDLDPDAVRQQLAGAPAHGMQRRGALVRLGRL